MNSGPTKIKLVFFGNERLVSGLKSTDAPVLSGLIERGYQVVAVVAHHTDTVSRGKRPLEVASIAAAHDIPLFTPNAPTDIYNQLKGFDANVAVLVAYGRIIPQKIIDLFPKGIINVHPSLLPAYRGSTPIETPILNGDAQSGVSIMSLAAKMDAGPVYAQADFSISPIDNKFDVYRKAAALSASLLFDTLPHILDGSISATPQDESKATYCSLLTKADGDLDPETQTAIEADRKVRAFLGFPKARLVTLGQSRIITRAHVSSQAKTPLDVVFLDGNYLSIDELVAPSGTTMSAAAFLNGYAAG